MSFYLNVYIFFENSQISKVWYLSETHLIVLSARWPVWIRLNRVVFSYITWSVVQGSNQIRKTPSFTKDGKVNSPHWDQCQLAHGHPSKIASSKISAYPARSLGFVHMIELTTGVFAASSKVVHWDSLCRSDNKLCHSKALNILFYSKKLYTINIQCNEYHIF